MRLPDAPLVVGVVGAGTMGAGIAQVCVAAGHEVVLYDVDEAAIARGRERVAMGLGRLVDKGRLAHDERASMLGAIREAHALASVAGQADVVVEAALEDIDLKREIFRALGAAAPAHAILATNTSALSVSALGEASGRPERVLGLHFFNPAPVMELVEVIVGRHTSRAVVDDAVVFVDGLGKTPVVCRDAPGFIVNRVNRPFTLEALRMLEAGEAGVEEIDDAIVGAGYPMGPLALMDLVGIDVNLAVATALWHAFDEPVRFEPSPVQRALVDAGRLGRKTGSGFYLYEREGARSVAGDLRELTGAPPAGAALPPAEIVARIELAIINEAYHAAGEGVADPPDIDRAMKLGANHPHGPFERAAGIGLRHVVAGLRRLEESYGVRYRVAPSLWQVASI